MYVCFRCSSIETVVGYSLESETGRYLPYVGCRECGLWSKREAYHPTPPAPSTTIASYAVICPTGCRLHNASTLLESQRQARKASRKTRER